MSEYDVVIKKVEPVLVASIRDIVPAPPEQGSLWKELDEYLAGQRSQLLEMPCLSVYYDEEYKERDWDIEVCIPVGSSLPETRRVKIYSLPGVDSMASTIHHGPFTRIDQAYQALMRWIDANGYRVCGPAREVYLKEAVQAAGDVSQTDPDTITEVQFPVEKA